MQLQIFSGVMLSPLPAEEMESLRAGRLQAVGCQPCKAMSNTQIFCIDLTLNWRVDCGLALRHLVAESAFISPKALSVLNSHLFHRNQCTT